MEIRSAAIEDLENIKKLNTDIFFRNVEYDNDAIENFAQTHAGNKYFKESLENKDGVFLVAEENEELVGYINGAKAEFPYRGSKYFELQNLGVLPSDKRKGFGTKLMEEFTRLVKERGYQRIYLNCYAKNEEALNFYRHLGYEDIDVCMEKPL